MVYILYPQDLDAPSVYVTCMNEWMNGPQGSSMPTPTQENLHCMESRGPTVLPRKAVEECASERLGLLIFFFF